MENKSTIIKKKKKKKKENTDTKNTSWLEAWGGMK